MEPQLPEKLPHTAQGLRDALKTVNALIDYLKAKEEEELQNSVKGGAGAGYPIFQEVGLVSVSGNDGYPKEEEEETVYRGSCGHVEYRDGEPYAVCGVTNCQTHKAKSLHRTFEDFTAKGAGGNEPVQYGKDCLTGALRCIICNKHYDDCPHKPPYITIPKPEWWEVIPHCQIIYLEALEAASKARGIEFKIE